MNLASLALGQIRSRPLHSLLNIVLLAIGMATVTLLLLLNTQLQERLWANARGIDLVVGAKGSPLQLILSTVYQADVPTGNIRLADAEQLARDPLVAATIPMALGDNFQGYRIVGTSPAYVQLYDGILSQGRLWSASMEAVLGAQVAAHSGLGLGQQFAGSHGLSPGGPLHDDHLYRVVGILRPTGTVLDEVVLTTPQSVWDLHDDAAHAGAAHELTALLVQYRSPLAMLSLPRRINAQTAMQAASPVMESTHLLKIVGFGMTAMRVFAVVLMLSAGLSLFVALYSSLHERRFDLAVMRMLGSSPRRLWLVVWLEGVLQALVGAVIGLLLAHGLVQILGWMQWIPGLPLSGGRFIAAEAWALLVALLIGSVAAALPAWRAYRTDIASVLSAR